MSDNEKNMEFNPYDRLIGPAPEPVNSPVILSGADTPDISVIPQAPVEIVPLAPAAVYSKVVNMEYMYTEQEEIIVEEDLLVPDTFPDVEMILNMDAAVTETTINGESGQMEVSGKMQLETMYRSAENFGNNISVLTAKINFRHMPKGAIPENGAEACIRVRQIEYHIINERKYRARIHMRLTIKSRQEKEHLIFDGIEGETLHLHKNEVRFAGIVSSKTKESEVSEELLINDEKIRPVKIIKSKFNVSENHRQLTGEKLILNQTVWVRILYLAEIASKGNLSNMPVLFQGKIDNTQFIPLSGDDEISACTVSTDAKGLAAEINHDSNGFRITGDIRTEAVFYGIREKDVVDDFYHGTEEMICDRRSEQICTGVENMCIDHMMREHISLQQEAGQDLRIIYLDAQIMEAECAVAGSVLSVRGKIQLEAVTMNEGDFTVAARKTCDFKIDRELGEAGCRVEPAEVCIREITGEISGRNEVDITAQIQIRINIYNEAECIHISNPCIVKSVEGTKHYPITVHTVRAGETLWDVGKKYKVSGEVISQINGPECMSPGNKIVIVK